MELNSTAWYLWGVVIILILVFIVISFFSTLSGII